MKSGGPFSDALWREKLKRDLRAVASLPLIIDDPSAALLQRRLGLFLGHHERLIEERLDYLIERPGVRLPLGKWYERVFFLALKVAFPDAEVYHSVSDQRGGELDFVVQSLKSYLHIECAIKFFLHVGESGSLSDWIGAGGKDRLDLKLKKMTDVQLRRFIPEFKSGDAPVQKIPWIPGHLHTYYFDRRRAWQSNPGPGINRGSIQGCWAYADQLDTVISGGSGRWICLPRQWWMTDFNGLMAGYLEEFDGAHIDLSQVDSVMLLNCDIQSGRCVELRRVMIVRWGFYE